MENEILNTEEAVNAEAEKAVQEDKDDFEKVMAAILLIVYNMEHTKVTATAISIYTPVAIVSPVTDEMSPYTPKCESNTRNTWCQK